MRRRDFLGVLGSVATAWPLGTRAQQAMPVVGFLHAAAPDFYAHILDAFHRGLKEAGYVDGQNVRVEYRWAHGNLEQLPELAADLVHRQVAVIVAGGGVAPAVAAKAATSTIPIVLAFGADPVKLGLVASLNRPSNNVTGVSFITSALGAKRLEILHDVLPHVRTIGFVFDPRTRTAEELKREILGAGTGLGWQVIAVEARNDRDFEAAFTVLTDRMADALIVNPDPLFTGNRGKLLALVQRARLPAIYHLREFVLDGGLMSYGASQVDTFRKAATYVGRILKGAKPADLPIQLPTKYELVINLTTAKALGLTVPPTLLARADEVIE